MTLFDDHRFPFMSDNVLLSIFRFSIMSVVDIMSWPWHRTKKRCSRYSLPLLSTCVVLQRLASAKRWRDLEHLFGRHKSQLSQRSWEGLMLCVPHRVDLLMSDVCAPFCNKRYAGDA